MTKERVIELLKIHPEGPILRWTKTGQRARILEAVYLSNNESNFLHFNARIEGKKGMWAIYPDDLEEIK